MSKANLYKLSNTIVSLFIGIIAAYYLYSLFSDKSATIDISAVSVKLRSNYLTLIIVLILMVLNWSIELYKWNYLLKRVQQLNLAQLIASLNLGILLSLLTPNRIGEFGGRQLYIEKNNRLTSFYFQSFSAFSQLLITILIGALSIGVYFTRVEGNYGFALAFLLISIVILALYLYSNLWFKWLSLFQKRFKKFVGGKITGLNRFDRIKVLGLSLFRYIVFSSQFVLLYSIFTPNSSILLIILGIAAVFLITAIIPTGWISDIAVRTSIAYYVFDKIELSGVDAMVCSILLWVINLLIPAILGLPYLSKVNWTQFKKVEE